jgi:hypothetical protein
VALDGLYREGRIVSLRWDWERDFQQMLVVVVRNNIDCCPRGSETSATHLEVCGVPRKTRPNNFALIVGFYRGDWLVM